MLFTKYYLVKEQSAVIEKKIFWLKYFLFKRFFVYLKNLDNSKVSKDTDACKNPKKKT